MHRIWLNGKREDFGVGSEYYDCEFTSRETLRRAVDVFGRTSSVSDVLLVDVGTFSYGNFGVFLKVLEDINVRGSIWFYGSRVFSAYPPTLRSRCVVVSTAFDAEREGVQEFLKEHNAEGFEKEFEYLSAYTLKTAWGMINSREVFITFMYQLEHGSKDNFYTLFSHIVELENSCCVHLFWEWFKDEKENILFSSKELEVCKFLRDGKFDKILFAFMSSNVLLETRLFSFLISYKMAKVLL